MTKSIAIIPARGGSKRLKRKNILPLAGKPLICWTIESALKSNLFEKVFVSTDDSEIALIAANAYATVLERPSSLATDNATCAQVCEWHLQKMASAHEFYDRLYCLYATSPLRGVDDLKAMDRVFSENADCTAVIAVTSYSHYPYQAFEQSETGVIRPYWPDLCRKKRSELPRFVAGNGSSYAVNINTFLQIRDFYAPSLPGLYSHYMSPLRSIDVDEESDFQLLEALLDSSMFENL